MFNDSQTNQERTAGGWVLIIVVASLIGPYIIELLMSWH